MAAERLLADAYEPTDPRFVRQMIDTHRALASLLVGMGHRPDAAVVATRIIDLIESQAASMEKRGGAASVVLPFVGGPGTGGGMFQQITDLFGRLELPLLAGRLRQLRERYPAPHGDRPNDRPNERPGDRPEGGDPRRR
jgi:hypothetical protein